jgi:hypothetical protein
MEAIHHLLQKNEPCLIGRIAGIELRVAYELLEGKRVSPASLAELENNAGIHVTSAESLKEYVTALIESYEACSLIGEWERQGPVYAITGKGQELVARRTPAIPKMSALALEPYYAPPHESWMSALTGKRILILHPFVHTFQQQLAHLKELYPDRPWFSGCTFQFIRPPLTLAGNHEQRDWKEHYTACIERLRTVEPFDVALVGAGGYGMLLSHTLYREHRASVIYIGGALQLFFGVIGKRWFSHSSILERVNDSWIRPVKEDQPCSFEKVERGCYW